MISSFALNKPLCLILQTMLSNFIEIAIRYGCSPVNLLHIFRTPFLRNFSWWLLLDKFKSIVVQKNQVLNQATHFMIGNNKEDILSLMLRIRLKINYVSTNTSAIFVNQLPINQMLWEDWTLTFLGFKAKKVLINIFILLNFSYCPLAWFISSAKWLKKVENLQKKA